MSIDFTNFLLNNSIIKTFIRRETAYVSAFLLSLALFDC